MISIFLLMQFRHALLRKEEERIAELEKKILEDGSTVEDIKAEKKWAEKAYALIDEAVKLRDQGFAADSLEFDALEKTAQKLGTPLPAFLREICQSIPKVKQESAQNEESSQNAEKAQTDQSDSQSGRQNDSPNRTVGFLLAEIRKKASWGKNFISDVKALMEEIQERFPDSVSQAQENIDIGREICQAKKEAHQLGREGKSEADFEDAYDIWALRIGEKNSYLKSQLKKQYNIGLATHARLTEAKQDNALSRIEADSFIMFDEMLTTYSLESSNIHPNFITALPPSKSWTILIDETGSDFSSNAQARSNFKRGKIVAVVIPDYCKLPELSAEYHAVGESPETIRNMVDTITRSPCGVLGISLNALHSLSGELWYVGVETLLDAILRLLPIDGQTSICVNVEQHMNFTPDMSTYLDTTCSSCVNRLSRTYPNRAKQIELTGKIVKKNDQLLIGYADTVAFCWGGSSVSSLLESSGWVNSCLLDSKPELLCSAIDSLQRQAPLDEREWDELINRRESGSPNSLAYALLTIQGQEASKDVNLWNRYFEYVQKHLYSKAINLYALGKQISWLKKWIPVDVKFTPRMRLLWLTTQLAQANHLGQTAMISQYQKEFEDLCTLIYPEDAPLTCLTCLHVAVAYMNDFNFNMAYNVVKDWVGKEEAIPGRLYYGQVLSTIGQLNAFIGNQKAAVDACNAAIARFEKLTNASEMANDINQTSSYKVIAMMDSSPVPDNMKAEMEKYLGRTLEEAADQFAVSDDPGEKYMHHVFLRYLVHLNSPELNPIIEKYLAHQPEWKTGYGHPWEMIQFYRAMLQTDVSARRAYLNLAYKLVAQTCDGTLKVIACVILGGLFYYDHNQKEELTALTKKVVEMMPYLGEARVAALENQLETPVEPLALAKAVLPFNFR